jgi:hypothetical protein
MSDTTRFYFGGSPNAAKISPHPKKPLISTLKYATNIVLAVMHAKSASNPLRLGVTFAD